MKTYTIELTRTITRTESVEVEIEAASREDARAQVLALPDECNSSCPEGVTGDDDEIGDWSVEAVNSDEANQEECLEILLGRKAA